MPELQTTELQTTELQTTGLRTTELQTTGLRTTELQTTGLRTTGLRTAKARTAGRLIAVIVTHDRLAHLTVTLERLLQADPAHLAGVLVVDNASTDGTGAWLARQSDARLQVLHLDRNAGGAGGFEAGLRHAMTAMQFDRGPDETPDETPDKTPDETPGETPGETPDAPPSGPPDWIVVMDDDAFPEAGALAAFHDADRDPGTAYVAAVRYPDGTICEMNRPGLNPFRRPGVAWRTLTGGGRDGYHLNAEAYAQTALRDVDMGSFVGLFLPAGAILRTGYPDGSLFLYGDDAIYSLRMRAKGIRLRFDPAVRFVHDCATYGSGHGGSGHGGSGHGVNRIAPLWKAYYLFRNRLRMYRHAGGILAWPLMLVLAAKWGLDSRHYGSESRRYRRIWIRAVRDGLGGGQGPNLAEVKALAAGKPGPAPPP